MKLIQLTEDYELKPFDCGDADLNGFLAHDAKGFHDKHIGKTFLLIDGEQIAAYFCLFNDKVSRVEASGSAWRKMKKLFPHDKHFSSYPAVKIGRLAVSQDYRNTGIGSKLMLSIKHMLNAEDTCSTFRFITVDAYLSAVPFYIKNDFKLLVSDDDDKHTRLMFFDMMEM
ncbi:MULTISPECIES: GNAT family N-acetyltransferase [Bacteroides]|uniref:GNAT family N-acetyltransferase n=1 Tax=Bacteroides TaxID=816 RepID=UPI000E42EEC9|nr:MULTISPECIES: GNAT family N-acetyltransferase [Bacteroides]MBS7575330.1 GNAT family N-acetyltransferase [Bacteroides propionicigenes]RGM30115.1 GNAT family N-acetyltransferase [Bacteroides sp. OM08-17BH]HBO06254.1 N-acetyltransferase [Bacteroides sp.]